MGGAGHLWCATVLPTLLLRKYFLNYPLVRCSTLGVNTLRRNRGLLGAPVHHGKHGTAAVCR